MAWEFDAGRRGAQQIGNEPLAAAWEANFQHNGTRRQAKLLFVAPTKADADALAASVLAGMNAAPVRHALAEAVRIADEAQDEWDKAPSGMRAGKILIALAGHGKGYRADTDAIHSVLAGAPLDPMVQLLRDVRESLAGGLETPDELEAEHSKADRELVQRIDAMIGAPAVG